MTYATVRSILGYGWYVLRTVAMLVVVSRRFRKAIYLSFAVYSVWRYFLAASIAVTIYSLGVAS